MGKNNEPTPHQKYEQRMAAQGISTGRQSAPVEVPDKVLTHFRTAIREEGGGPVRKGTGLAVPVLCAIENRGVALPDHIEAIANYLVASGRCVATQLVETKTGAAAKAEAELT